MSLLYLLVHLFMCFPAFLYHHTNSIGYISISFLYVLYYVSNAAPWYCGNFSDCGVLHMLETDYCRRSFDLFPSMKRRINKGASRADRTVKYFGSHDHEFRFRLSKVVKLWDLRFLPFSHLHRSRRCSSRLWSRVDSLPRKMKERLQQSVSSICSTLQSEKLPQ
jgi:hypothetical protein